MHIRSMIIVLISSLVVITPMAGGSDAFADTHGSEEITAAVIDSFPPFYHPDDEGLPTGFAIEAMDELARQAGLQINYQVYGSWAEVMEAVRSGKADLIPNIGITDSRSKDFLFTDPVITFPISIIVRTDTTGIAGMPDLVGRKVGVVENNAAIKLFEDRADIEVSVLGTFSDALFQLFAGHLDAIAYPELVAWRYAFEANLQEKIRAVHPPLTEIKRAIAINRDREDLLNIFQPAAQKFILSARYKEIYLNWFSEPEPFWSIRRVALLMGGIILLVLVLMVVWRHISVLRLNRQLGQAEERFQDLTTNIPGVVYQFRINAEGEPSYPYVSPTILNVLGLNPLDVIEDADIWLKQTHPEDRSVLDASIAESHENLSLWKWEGRMFRASGEVGWFRGTSEPRRLSDGSTLWNGIFLDITDLIDTEEKLSQQTELLKEAEILASFGHWELQVKTGELFWSDQVYRIHGLEVGEQVDVDAAIEAYHPDDREKVATCVQNAIEKGEDFEFELRILRADGEVRHVKSVGIVHKDDGGSIESVFGIFQDIHQLVEARDKLVSYQTNLEKLVEERTHKLQQSEEKFAEFYSIIPDVFMVTNLQGGSCIEVNEGFSRVTGYTRDEVIGKQTTDLHLWENDDERVRLVTGLMDGGTVDNLEAKFRRKNGSIWYGMMSARVVQIGDDGFILSATKDITEIDESREEAIKASRAKSEFLSSMSHELRTPLNAILGFAQIMDLDSKQPLSEKQKSFVAHIIKGGDYLLELIDQVLELNRIEAGKLVVNIEQTGVRRIFNECLRLIRISADEEGIEIVDQTAEQDIPLLHTDGTRLKQVLLNLLSNAVKYNHSGGSVTLSCQKVREEILRINVTDTGTGIPADQFENLFSPFERLGLEAGEIEGTGIGLTITKQIIELLGGQIGFDSASGKGSTFWVEVPISNKQGIIEVITRDGEDGPDQVSGRGHDEAAMKTILYIEDNSANIVLMESVIDSIEKVRLLSAPTAELGYDLARSESPDLILMDINLPGMNGIEALEKLRNTLDTSEIPVIAVSALAMPGDIEAGNRAGFKQYVTKPFNIAELVKTIERELHA